jgi:hypothetical protein
VISEASPPFSRPLFSPQHESEDSVAWFEDYNENHPHIDLTMRLQVSIYNFRIGLLSVRFFRGDSGENNAKICVHSDCLFDVFILWDQSAESRSDH